MPTTSVKMSLDIEDSWKILENAYGDESEQRTVTVLRTEYEFSAVSKLWPDVFPFTICAPLDHDVVNVRNMELKNFVH